jgi:hypothetical protein
VIRGDQDEMGRGERGGEQPQCDAGNSKGSRGRAAIMDCRVRHVPFIKGPGERSTFARPCRSFVCDPFQAHTHEREREREQRG